MLEGLGFRRSSKPLEGLRRFSSDRDGSVVTYGNFVRMMCLTLKQQLETGDVVFREGDEVGPPSTDRLHREVLGTEYFPLRPHPLTT